MTLEDIETLITTGTTPALEVHSVDPAMYLIFRRDGERLLPLQDSRGQALKYPSRYAALKKLADCGVDEVTFLHRSAYGEMIGLAGEAQPNELSERLNLAHLR